VVVEFVSFFEASFRCGLLFVNTELSKTTYESSNTDAQGLAKAKLFLGSLPDAAPPQTR
jgi:hypothetical protein